VVVLAVLALGQAARAGEPSPTTITVEGMHCMGCAKKMAARLYEVPGVAGVQANVSASTLTVASKPAQAPSPRALWDAVERAGYQPVKLEGPGGTFTAKPPA
jgi:Cu+-exporting ATPase